MAKRRWFYMSVETLEIARHACEALHAQEHPGEELRMIWNADHTACLICLDGASKEWRAPQAWIDDCEEVYCRTSYPGLSQIPANSPWKAPDNANTGTKGGERFWDGESWVAD